MENTSELPGTLSDAAWNATSVHRSVILVVSGSLLLAFLAQVQIPLRPVPITGQTLGVLLVGALLGSRLGALSVLLYLTYGVIGLPVFAGASAGPNISLGLPVDILWALYLLRLPWVG